MELGAILALGGDNMELRLLNYFLAVAREQSISAAAESLHISQPALSVQLKSLEDEFGKKLFIRGTKGARRVVLTDDGMLLRKRAEEIMTLVRKTEDEMNSADTIAGEVVIGAGETDIIRYFARTARCLQAEHPDIHYHIYSGNAEYVLEYLDKGLIDFGLLFTDIDENKYEFIDLPVHDHLGLLVQESSPLAARAEIKPADIEGIPLIVSLQKGDLDYIARWAGRGASELNIVATYNLVFNATLLVEEGVGSAVCFDKLVNTSGRGLCFRPFSPPLEVSARIVWKKYQVFSKAASAFLRCLEETIGIKNK